MSSDHDERLATSLAADIAISIAVLTIANAVILLAPGGPVRILVAAVAVLLLPGYALTTAAFPASDRGVGSNIETNAGIDLVTRLVIAVGTSVPLAFLAGFAVDYGGYALDSVPLLVALDIIVVVFLVVGVVRRFRLPPERRFLLSAVIVNLVENRDRDQSQVDWMLNLGLAVAVLLALTSFAYALAAPPDGTEYTSVRLLTEMSSGEYAAAGYQTEFERGERGVYVLAIENQERRLVEYNVIIMLQRVGGKNNETILETKTLGQLDRAVEDNETVYVRHGVEPTLTGTNLRLVYLVYRGEPPARPTIENAYRYLTLWITVNDTASDGEPVTNSSRVETADSFGPA